MRKIAFVIMTILLLFSIVSYASANEIEEIEQNLEKQHKTILEELRKHSNKDKDYLNEIFNKIDERDRQNNEEASLGALKRNIRNALISMSLKARILIFPITIIVLIYNIIMLATFGTKNLKKRKKYLFGSIVFYVLFLIILNIPILILWSYSLEDNFLFTVDNIYKATIVLSEFFRKNSFNFAIIILAYGFINNILSANNISKRLSSSYMMKMAVIMFIAFQTLPWILKLAL